MARINRIVSLLGWLPTSPAAPTGSVVMTRFWRGHSVGWTQQAANRAPSFPIRKIGYPVPIGEWEMPMGCRSPAMRITSGRWHPSPPSKAISSNLPAPAPSKATLIRTKTAFSTIKRSMCTAPILIWPTPTSTGLPTRRSFSQSAPPPRPILLMRIRTMTATPTSPNCERLLPPIPTMRFRCLWALHLVARITEFSKSSAPAKFQSQPHGLQFCSAPTKPNGATTARQFMRMQTACSCGETKMAWYA